MRQDFYSIFRLGNNEKSISTIDPAGVALAAIQALKQQLDLQQQLIGELSSTQLRLQKAEEDFKLLQHRILMLEQNAPIRSDKN